MHRHTALDRWPAMTAFQEFCLTISPNGSDLQRLVQDELKTHVRAQSIARHGQARFSFRVDMSSARPESFKQLRAPEKVYALVIRKKTSEIAPWLGDLSGTEAEDALAEYVASADGWPGALETWRNFVADARSSEDQENSQDESSRFAGKISLAELPRSFRVTGKRSGKFLGHLSSNGICEALGEAVAKHHEWGVALRGFDLEVVLHVNDEMLFVSLPLLERSDAKQANFRMPGLTQPVAWAMARTADINPGDQVLDPMCGSGIILLEAAQSWSSAQYLGFDTDPNQICRAAENLSGLTVRTRRSIGLGLGDATRLPVATASCNVILCDLPFGKQFGSLEDNEVLYPHAAAEFRRVLKLGGRAVLLTNQANSAKLVDTLSRPDCGWEIKSRRPLSMGFMEAVLIRADAVEFDRALQPPPPESERLPWEDPRGRAKWGSLRAKERAPLQPTASLRQAAAMAV